MAGHVRRLLDIRIIKVVWEEAPVAKTPLGRPHLQSRDNIGKDLTAINIHKPMDFMEDRQQVEDYCKVG